MNSRLIAAPKARVTNKRASPNEADTVVYIFGFFFFCHFVLAQTLIYDLWTTKTRHIFGDRSKPMIVKVQLKLTLMNG